MTRKVLGRETVILTGTGGIAGVLFWMGIYLAGPISIIPGAVALLVALALFRRRMTDGQALAERTMMACLLAAQVSLLAAVCIEVLPVVFEHVL